MNVKVCKISRELPQQQKYTKPQLCMQICYLHGYGSRLYYSVLKPFFLPKAAGPTGAIFSRPTREPPLHTHPLLTGFVPSTKTPDPLRLKQPADHTAPAHLDKLAPAFPQTPFLKITPSAERAGPLQLWPPSQRTDNLENLHPHASEILQNLPFQNVFERLLLIEARFFSGLLRPNC